MSSIKGLTSSIVIIDDPVTPLLTKAAQTELEKTWEQTRQKMTRPFVADDSGVEKKSSEVNNV